MRTHTLHFRDARPAGAPRIPGESRFPEQGRDSPSPACPARVAPRERVWHHSRSPLRTDTPLDTLPPDRFSDDKLFVDAYEDIRRLARRRVQQSGIDSLQATDLVNETYLKLARQGQPLKDRSELMPVAAWAMRNILVDRARRKASTKRGGDWKRVNWDGAPQVAIEFPEHLLMLDDALSRLSGEDPDCAAVVELIFYAGLTGEEAAAALGVSASTVDRRWRFARSWLHRQLSGDE